MIEHSPAVERDLGVNPRHDPGVIGDAQRPRPAGRDGRVKPGLPAHDVVPVELEHRAVVEQQHAERRPGARPRHQRLLVHRDAADRAEKRLGVVEVPVLAVHALDDRRFGDVAAGTWRHVPGLGQRLALPALGWPAPAAPNTTASNGSDGTGGAPAAERVAARVRCPMCACSSTGLAAESTAPRHRSGVAQAPRAGRRAQAARARERLAQGSTARGSTARGWRVQAQPAQAAPAQAVPAQPRRTRAQRTRLGDLRRCWLGLSD